MAFEDHSHSRTLQAQTSTQTQTKTLNVFLHGTFVFLEQTADDEIRAVLPKIDHHIYRAGSWLGETDLQAGDYRLQGVLTGLDQFDPLQNLIFKRPQPQFDRTLAHATLTLPRPEKITSLRVATVPLDSFESPANLESSLDTTNSAAQAGSSVHTPTIATLQIFTYRFENDETLFLESEEKGGPSEIGGHYWEPAMTGEYINLHIFSAEDHHHGPSNAAADFKACMKVLGLNLELQRVHAAGGIKDSETLPAGVKAEETEDLAPRTARMARLGRLLRDQGDLNQAWSKNEALDDDPPACGGFIGH